MTSRERRATRQRRAARELTRDVRKLERYARSLGLDLDDVDSRVGMVEQSVEQLDTDVRNLEADD